MHQQLRVPGTARPQDAAVRQPDGEREPGHGRAEQHLRDGAAHANLNICKRRDSFHPPTMHLKPAGDTSAIIMVPP